MTDIQKEEMEIGDSWEMACTPYIGSLYKCIDGSGLIVRCLNDGIHMGEYMNTFIGKVVFVGTSTEKIDSGGRYYRSAFKFHS